MRKGDRTLLDEIEDDALKGRAVADTLRKIVILGGRARSESLRDWASLELKGYQTADQLPSYRRLHAPVKVSGINGRTQITGQTVSVFHFPEFARESLEAGSLQFQGIGEIELTIRNAEERGKSVVQISVPNASGLAAVMNRESGDPYRVIDQIYFDVHVSALHGLVDQVRTTLVELIAAIRDGTPGDEDVPSREVANHAVQVVVHGGNPNINVAAPVSAGRATVKQNAASGATRSSWLSRSWKWLVGASGVVAAIVAAAEWRLGS